MIELSTSFHDKSYFLFVPTNLEAAANAFPIETFNKVKDSECNIFIKCTCSLCFLAEINFFNLPIDKNDSAYVTIRDVTFNIES